MAVNDKSGKEWAYLFSEQDFPDKSISKEPGRNIWSVAGGKGGVGKSFVASNLAVFLAGKNKKVTLVDLDLGCPNLHTCLGMKGARKNITDFIKGRVRSLDDAAVETGFDNLKLVSGVRDSITTANFSYVEKQKLIKAIRKLNADYIILDLSAGVAFNTLDFFLMSSMGLFVTVPEPTSVENLYRFVKAIILRLIGNENDDREIVKLLKIAEDEKNELNISHPVDLLDEINRISPESHGKFVEMLSYMNLKLIINQARKEDDIRVGSQMEGIFKNYFGLNVDYAGHIDHDFSAWQSVQGGKILLRDFPNSVSAQCIEKIAKKLSAL